MENYQIGGIGVEVEIDESKFGKRKYHRGHRVDGVWVFGGVERTPERKCFLVAVEDRKKPTLEALIKEFILPGSIIISDKFPSYEDLEGTEDFWYQHEVVNHSENYKDPITGACTNTIEGTWNGVKKLVPTRKRTEEGIIRAWGLVILTFIEPPRWCSIGEEDDANNCQVLFDLEGPPAISSDNNDDNTTTLGAVDESVTADYYPSSGSLLLTTAQSQFLELVFVSFISLVMLFRVGRDGCSIVRYFRKGPALLLRSLQIIAIAAIYLGLGTGYTFFQPIARLLLLGTLLRSLHMEVANTLLVLPQVLNICAMLAIYVFFWAFMGTVLFYETDQGVAGFSTFVESLWTLWICITTANYPDVMMPSYNQNRLSGPYFVIFMIVTFFFFMNLILSSIVNTYDDIMSERKKERKAREDAKLSEAFQLMDQSKTIDRDTVMTLFRILNKDFPEFRHISSRDAKLLFAVLDRDGSAKISQHEFLDFGSIMLLEFFHEEEFATSIQLYFPKLYNSERYQNFLTVVKSEQFETAIDIILVMNAVVVVIQSWPLLIGDAVTQNEDFLDGTIDTVWELIEAIFTAIYCVEAILKIVAMGWNNYIEKAKNVFDFIITILAFLATAYVYYPNDYSDSRLIRYIVMARVVRIARVVIAFKPFRVIGIIWYEVMPYATSVLILLFFIMYAFASLGVELYGGMVSRDPSNPYSYLILNTDFSDNDYWANNFNDLISAFNVLFNLLVVNNWTECEIGFEAVSQTRWVRYYFFAFHFAGVILVNNLVVAFFINAFLAQGKILANRKEELALDNGEAVIHGREASFDASEITGTRTSVRGGFIARIRTTHAEEDEQDRLRRLFTQTSEEDEIRFKPQEEHEWTMPFARS
ncbi:pore calcium channel protein 1 [Seminavis robusta]|uniref:Pore calcium channel protein 1 n=1 Tax=Seminavis robusta TaxID=568900 RepID=A0A9N8EEE3_9STRA|nr:pore calcium channel protein 1 [Seminavis robusta]|eukprot:Sro1059_g236570.1 pore calcium channel protein 1 (872) ;mRNA; r:32205-35506